MSSHREAPAISKDASADNTDVYAFVNPHNADHVVLIANYIPFELPYGGPNFAEFADDVVYTINVANQGTAQKDISYEFRFTTHVVDDGTFLYNDAPIGKKSTGYSGWNRRQTYSLTRVIRTGKNYKSTVLAKNLAVPPVNVGARSTPDYDANFTSDAVHMVGGPGGIQTFAGQRADAFKVDLGSIFDLGGIRGLNAAHELPLQNMPGVNGLDGLNVHTIAMMIPITQLSRHGGTPTNPKSPASCIGVWATGSRAHTRVFDAASGTYKSMGADVQVSRLGNPLFNEVINPMVEKDKWNAADPSGDSAFAKYCATPVLAELLPSLYPGAFPNLAAFNASKKPRVDIEAVLLTGIPYGVVKDSSGNALPYSTATGGPEADLLRLNLAIPPTPFTSSSFSKYGVLGGDLAGFPNGRRVLDDVTTIELRAIAGATIPLIYPSFTPDGPVANLHDGSANSSYTNPTAPSGADVMLYMPFMPAPNSGYATTPLAGSTGGASGVVGAPATPGTGDGNPQSN